ncbi:MAG: bifunctional adenosylcobinamide kinase/adenosylcobinamide-phosphate guanylyltransferase [Thiohalomonadales bacterium]
MKYLILGGTRSGKSLYAEKVAASCNKSVTYVATAQNSDPEMQRRIATHQLRRPAEWCLIEEPLELGLALDSVSATDPSSCILVDCLTLWLNNLYYHQDSQHNPPSNNLSPSPHAGQDIEGDTNVNAISILVAQHCNDLVDNVELMTQDIVLVSSEVGMGLTPDNVLARDYADRLGELNQALAIVCDRVIFCVAGIPQLIKGNPIDEL